MWTSAKALCVAALLLGSLAGAQSSPPAEESLVVEVTREAHVYEANEFWEPYVVWWIEDAAGRLVKILSISFYDDNTEDVVRICGKFGYLYALTYYRARFGDEGCPDKALGEWCTPGSCPRCPFDYSAPVDGVTGCSEALNPNAATVMTRTWNLTGRDGKKVSAGLYYFLYSAAVRDDGYIRPGRGQDKVFKVPVTLSGKSYDTTFQSPPDILGQSGDIQLRLASIRIALGKNSLTGSGAGGPSGGSGTNLPNRPPAPPTADAPHERGFCGNGSGLSALILVFCLKLRRRIRR